MNPPNEGGNFFSLSRNNDIGARWDCSRHALANSKTDKASGMSVRPYSVTERPKKPPLAMIFKLQAACGDDTICLSNWPLFKSLHFLDARWHSLTKKNGLTHRLSFQKKAGDYLLKF